MTPGTAAVADRLMAHPRFRWMPGMRTASTRRVCWTTEAAEGRDVPGGIYDHDMRVRPDNGLDPWADVLPDLDDPGTCGCLLAMLPEVRTLDKRGGTSWRVGIQRPGEDVGETITGATLGIALATALLDVWGTP